MAKKCPAQNTQFKRFAWARWPWCQWCGCLIEHPHYGSADHIVPRSRGGSNDWANLVLACKPCNRRRGSQVGDETKIIGPRWEKMRGRDSVHIFESATSDRFSKFKPRVLWQASRMVALNIPAEFARV